MKKLFLLICTIGLQIGFSQSRDIEYIKKYALLAVQEMEKYKIPASITLAQGILETGGGQSRLAEQANNHFGIKCKKEWQGASITHDDDALGECFRKYSSVEESYDDHSKFLAERPYYRKLFSLSIDDYRGWAFGLKKAGYATNPRYAYILIDKIEKYKLYSFDKISSKGDAVYTTLVSLYGDVDKRTILGYNPPKKENTYAATIEKENSPTAPPKKATTAPDTRVVQQRKYVNNLENNPSLKQNSPNNHKSTTLPLNKDRIRIHPVGRKYIIVQRGETIKKIAEAYDIRECRLMRYNDLEDPRQLQANQYLFLERKRNKGSRNEYRVQQGDSMYSISQKMGIKLKCLYYRNRMEKGSEPNVGEILYLRGRKPRR